jgi:hypothetical protein
MAASKGQIARAAKAESTSGARTPEMNLAPFARRQITNL